MRRAELYQYLPLLGHRSRTPQPDWRKGCALSRSQRTVLALGLLVIAFFGVYVPFHKQTVLVNTEFPNGRWEDQSRDYTFLWHLPTEGAVGVATESQPDRLYLISITIDLRTVLLTWAATVCVTGAVVVLLGLLEPRPPPDRKGNGQNC